MNTEKMLEILETGMDQMEKILNSDSSTTEERIEAAAALGGLIETYKELKPKETGMRPVN